MERAPALYYVLPTRCFYETFNIGIWHALRFVATYEMFL